MKRLVSILFVVTLITGCNVFNNEQQVVFGEIENELLTIYNISKNDVYINILVTETVPYTFWASFSKESNRIAPGSSSSVPTKFLFSYEKGKEITVFFGPRWSQPEKMLSL